MGSKKNEVMRETSINVIIKPGESYTYKGFLERGYGNSILGLILCITFPIGICKICYSAYPGKSVNNNDDANLNNNIKSKWFLRLLFFWFPHNDWF